MTYKNHKDVTGNIIMAVYFKHRESITINMTNYKKVFVVIGICYYFRKK